MEETKERGAGKAYSRLTGHVFRILAGEEADQFANILWDRRAAQQDLRE